MNEFNENLGLQTKQVDFLKAKISKLKLGEQINQNEDQQKSGDNSTK